jgi:polar amino acid transport system substrate-binding protein
LVLAKQKIVGALDPSYPPFEFYDQKSGKVVGVDVDLVNAIAEELGYEIEIQDMSYGGIMPALLAGKIDFIASPITINEERKKNVNFTQETSHANLTILVSVKDTTTTDLKGLESKRIGARLGTTSATVAHGIKDAKVTDFDSGDTMLMALTTGKIDAVIDEHLVNKYFIEASKDSAKNQVRQAGKPFNDKSYAFAISKKNKSLVKDFDKALKSLRKNGKFEAIVNKWFEKDWEKGAFGL